MVPLPHADRPPRRRGAFVVEPVFSVPGGIRSRKGEWGSNLGYGVVENGVDIFDFREWGIHFWVLSVGYQSSIRWRVWFALWY